MSAPTEHPDLDDRLQSLSPAKRAALEAMLLARKSGRAGADRIAPCAPDERATLSHAERRLWLLDRLEPSHPFYNMPLAAKLVGDFDSAAFGRALVELTRRHETLRYAYSTTDGRPERRIVDEVDVAPEVVDLRGQSLDEDALAELLREHARRPFDLDRPPLLRCVVFEQSDRHRVVLLVMHHIVSDGWSMWVMLNELAELYERERTPTNGCGRPATLGPLPIQYSDFAAWQRDRLEGEGSEKQLAYWKEKLATDAPALELPLDRPRPPVADFDGAARGFRLSAGVSESLRRTAEATGATPFMILMAAYQAWLLRHTDQADFCVGTVVAGRPRAELERLIGFFVNTLAIRADVAGDPTFAELIERVRGESLDAFSHQELPFDQIIEAAAPDRDRSHDALFQTALVVQNPPRDFARTPGLELTPLLVDNGTAKYDLTFFFWEDEGGWAGQIEYRTSLFEPSTIDRFLASFETLLDDALRQPETPVSQLAVLDAEQAAALERWNQTDAPLESPQLIHEQVASWIADQPEQTALRFDGGATTYRELGERSAQIAAGLQAAGVAVDEAVVVCLPRSADSVAAMLAVWRAGGVYVPTDVDMARSRLAPLVEACGAKLVVAAADVEVPAATRRVAIDELTALADGAALAPPELTPDCRAYVIFTSGSTGEPKGVEVEHRTIVNFVRAQAERVGATRNDRVLHSLSPAFDGGLSETLLGIANGATLVVARQRDALDPQRLTRLLVEERVTMAKFTPAVLATLDPHRLGELRTVVSAGDLLTGGLAARWQPGRRFFNGYGPTEVTVGVSMYELPAPPTQPPPIGAPMANMKAYVLDGHGRQTPIGVTGEIFIGGVGVARGYLNRPEQTAARFHADAFATPSAQNPSPRMYKTGDLGRWRADGVLEFVGRADEQVQIRGYRVEPGEVTAALSRLPDVAEAFTCVAPDAVGGQRLVSYVVPASGADAADDESDHLASWQNLMTQTHQNTGVLRDPEFDTTGWVSTFTGLPIPRDEMQAWAESTIARIMAHGPQDVLEIGCGGGLILLGAAPRCRSYVGTDFLERSLRQLQGVLDRKSDDWSGRVELFQQAAHELGPLAGRTFDTIVLNSVVQYFPSVDYLLTVLRRAASLLKPGGRIFVGDVRNLWLHEAMAAAVERHRAEEELSRRELLGRVEARLRHEEELLIAPEFFSALAKVLPRLTGCRFDLKEGPAGNELTHYRYDVVLSFDEPEGAVGDPIELDGVTQTPAAVIQRFLAEGSAVAIVRGLVNPRVAGEVAAWRALRDDVPVAVADGGVDPDEWRAAAAAGVDVQVQWAARESPERYEVVLRRAEAGRGASLAAAAPVDWSALANRPLEEKRSARLTPQLREQLAERLPAYMVPASYVVLEHFPRTVQGKVDRDALPPPPSGRPAWTTGYVEPTDEHQRLVARVWEELLGVSPVGADDDFFDLGGHSMLAVRVMAEIETRTGVAVPLAAMFQEPTVRHLAMVLRDPAAADAASSLIELQSSGDGAPLVCVHPAGGTVFCYQALAERFAGERPVIGLQAVGVDGRRPPHESMDEMVEHYAKLLRARLPEGPIHLCGWSLGGNIAYAVAARLREEGVDVGLVGLFDAGATPPEESLSEQDLAPLLQALFPDSEHLPLEELRQLSADEQVAYFTERAAQAGLVDAAQLAASKHVYAVFQKNVQAVHRHRTGAYGGRVTLFRAADQQATNPLAADRQLGWGELAAGVDVFDTPSDHAQMMKPPQVDVLVDNLREELARIEANPGP